MSWSCNAQRQVLYSSPRYLSFTGHRHMWSISLTCHTPYSVTPPIDEGACSGFVAVFSCDAIKSDSKDRTIRFKYIVAATGFSFCTQGCGMGDHGQSGIPMLQAKVVLTIRYTTWSRLSKQDFLFGAELVQADSSEARL